MNAPTPVLFIDGPLAGQWRDMDGWDMRNAHYQHVEPPSPTIETYLAENLQPNQEIKYTDYLIDVIRVFHRELYIGHTCPRTLLEAGAYRYLVHPDVQAKLDATG